MANKKTKNSNEYVWALLAPRVNHLFGVFPSLDAASISNPFRAFLTEIYFPKGYNRSV